MLSLEVLVREFLAIDRFAAGALYEMIRLLLWSQRGL